MLFIKQALKCCDKINIFAKVNNLTDGGVPASLSRTITVLY